MKRLSLLTAAFLNSTLLLGVATVSAQNEFPTTGIGAYSSAIDMPEAGIQSSAALNTWAQTRLTSTQQPAPAQAQPSASFQVVNPNQPTLQTAPAIQTVAPQAHGEVFSAPVQVQAVTPQSGGVPQPMAKSPEANAAAQNQVVMMQNNSSAIAANSNNNVSYQEVVVDDNCTSCSAARFSPAMTDRALMRQSSSVFTTAGVSALLFDRNHGANRNFSTNAAGDVLASSNAVNDLQAGIDVFAARRRSSGHGWEARYFGLYPEDQSIQIGGNATTLLPGLSQIGTDVTGTGATATLASPSAASFFNSTDTHVLTRNTELNNIEFNILKNVQPRFRALSTEMLFGFRYFHFAETLLCEAVDIPAGGSGFPEPDSIGYFASTENHLLGLQVGARSDYRLRGRVMLHAGFKVGAFNNNVRTRQRVDYRMADGSIINPNIAGGALSGQAFDVGSEDDVKSLLGELDIALSLQMSDSARVRIGYRAVGATDIAFASNQVQDDFTDATRLTIPYSDSNLVTQGTYLGLELAY